MCAVLPSSSLTMPSMLLHASGPEREQYYLFCSASLTTWPRKNACTVSPSLSWSVHQGWSCRVRPLHSCPHRGHLLLSGFRAFHGLINLLRLVQCDTHGLRREGAHRTA